MVAKKLPKSSFCTLKNLEIVKLEEKSTGKWDGFCTLKNLEIVKLTGIDGEQWPGFCTLKNLEIVKQVR